MIYLRLGTFRSFGGLSAVQFIDKKLWEDHCLKFINLGAASDGQYHQTVCYFRFNSFTSHSPSQASGL